MREQLEIRVFEAKESMDLASDLIIDYIPYIKSQASRVSGRSISDSDDELSIGMIAFHEAIKSYRVERGSFISYASILIKSRIIDYYRSQKRHGDMESLDKNLQGDEDLTLKDTIRDSRDHYKEMELQKDLKREIELFIRDLATFDMSITDIADNTPRQERTLRACRDLCNYVIANPILLEEVINKKKLPIKVLSQNTGISIKTIERHRKYLIAILLIQTNGFYLIRDHLKEVLGLERGVN